MKKLLQMALAVLMCLQLTNCEHKAPDQIPDNEDESTIVELLQQAAEDGKKIKSVENTADGTQLIFDDDSSITVVTAETEDTVTSIEETGSEVVINLSDGSNITFPKENPDCTLHDIEVKALHFGGNYFADMYSDAYNLASYCQQTALTKP